MVARLALFVLLFLGSTGLLGAEGQIDIHPAGVIKKFNILVLRVSINYPKEGTSLGRWLVEKTNVWMRWGYRIGAFAQTIDSLNAQGNYPDVLDAGSANEALYTAKVFIPLDDLIEKYGVNIKKRYAEYLELLRRPDGHIYWLPPSKVRLSEGIGITVKCRDPVSAFRWLDALASEEFHLLMQWGIRGETYTIDPEGQFYRTPEQRGKWEDRKWRDKIFGRMFFLGLIDRLEADPPSGGDPAESQ